MHVKKYEFIGAVTCLQFSRDRAFLYVVTGSTLYIYNANTFTLLSHHQVLETGILYGLDTTTTPSKAQHMLFYGQNQLQCAIQTLQSSHISLSLYKYIHTTPDWVLKASILSENPSSDPKFPLIAVGMAHNTVQIIDIGQGTVIHSISLSEQCLLCSLELHGRSIETLLVAAGLVTRAILIFHPFGPMHSEPIAELEPHDGAVFCMLWSETREHFVSLSEDRSLQLWRYNSLAQTFTHVFRSYEHQGRLWDACFVDNMIVTASEDGSCRVWDIDTGKSVATLLQHAKHVWRVACMPGSFVIASGGSDGAVKLWDLRQQLSLAHPLANSRRYRISIQENAFICTLLHADSETFSCVLENGHVHALNEKSSVPLALYDSGARISCASYVCDGKFLVLGDCQGFFHCIDMNSNEKCLKWPAHRCRVLHIWSFSDERTIFSSAADGTLMEHKLCNDSWRHVATYTDSQSKASISSVHRIRLSYFVCGDSHGNVLGFLRNDGDASPVQPHFRVPRAHGREFVSCIVTTKKDTIVTGGHDGYFQVFCIGSKECPSLIPRERESVKGIGTITRLFYDAYREELFVFGFHANCAVLVNATRQYRLFEEECGGWRRPYVLCMRSDTLFLPSYTFLYVQHDSESEISVQKLKYEGVGVANEEELQQCAFHYDFHARLATCVQILDVNGECIVSVSEDTKIKLFLKNQTGLYKCVSTAVRHTTAIRAMTSFETEYERIVITGGGKQVLCAWKVNLQSPELVFLCTYEKKARQDHRILCLTSLAWGNENRLVISGNSEGRVMFVRFCAEKQEFMEIGVCDASDKPILSIAAAQSGSLWYVITGSTDGMIRIYDISALLRVSEHSNDWVSLAERAVSLFNVSFCYLAHDMGVNCLSVVAMSENTETGSCEENMIASLSVFSGGDDQNIRIRTVSQRALGAWTVECDSRTLNASDSAIKSLYTDGKRVIIAGYSQRVSTYERVSDRLADPLVLCGSVMSECADISSLSVVRQDELWRVAVAGQGMQVMEFKDWQVVASANGFSSLREAQCKLCGYKKIEAIRSTTAVTHCQMCSLRCT